METDHLILCCRIGILHIADVQTGRDPWTSPQPLGSRPRPPGPRPPISIDPPLSPMRRRPTWERLACAGRRPSAGTPARWQGDRWWRHRGGGVGAAAGVWAKVVGEVALRICRLDKIRVRNHPRMAPLPLGFMPSQPGFLSPPPGFVPPRRLESPLPPPFAISKVTSCFLPSCVAAAGLID
jgi:hypothetical protein